MQLIWIDTETSGLVPSKDHILEVAVALATLEDPFDVHDPDFRPASWVLHQEPAFIDGKPNEVADGIRLPTTMHPKVIEMHTKSGLFDECHHSTYGLGDIEHLLLGLIPEAEPSDDPARPEQE
jgi:oligoribonuclease (3'-5' exoribonuclease)